MFSTLVGLCSDTVPLREMESFFFQFLGMIQEELELLS